MPDVRADPLAGFPPALRTQMRAGFVEEATALVEELEAGLLSLSHRPDDVEAMNASFRAVHTIKGSAAGIGFLSVADFTHHVEDTLDQVRQKALGLAPNTVSALLEAVDLIRALLAADAAGSGAPDTSSCLARLHHTANPPAKPLAASTHHAHTSDRAPPDAAAFAGFGAIHLGAPVDELGTDTHIYSVRFKLPPNAFNRGFDPLVLLQALSDQTRVIRSTPNFEQLPPLDELDPERCYLGFSLIVATHVSEADLRAVFEFCPEDSSIEITRYEDHLTEPEVVEQAIETQRAGTLTLESEPARPTPRHLGPDEGSIVRVKQSKLDGLINLVGELATARNALLHLQRTVEADYALPELSKRMKDTSAVINRSVSQLQADVLSLRIVTVRTSFQRLPRVVHDVASTNGKLIELLLLGEETELDKTVADALVDPLVHIVRNSADHGVENAVDRRAAGKPEVGSVQVEARREGSGVVIEVRDDGRGMDPHQIRRAAISQGVIDADAGARLSDAEALDLIFTAGFSTAREVTSISGRGVGMDVVRSNLARIGGTVNVRSELGKGTTIRLNLPLTLSVFRAMLMRAAGEVFALPLESVREITNVTAEACHTVRGRQVTRVAGELVGLVPLGGGLGLPSPAAAQMDPQDRLVIVVDGGGKRVGLVVDSVAQPQEIMVKPVEGYLSAGGAIAGTSVMGDGRVALVLEPAATVALALAYARSGVSADVAG